LIKSIKERFHQELKEKFSKTEIESFLNLLFEKFLGLSRLEMVLKPEINLSKEEEKQFENALKRLKNSEPIQYIIGETDFYGLKFKVDKNVLIPRPETEELVDWILKENPTSSSILDIGTGSGCIAISLAKNLKSSKVFAWDVSEKALETAKNNAEINKAKVEFQLKNILAEKSAAEKFDIIVSNPPYVRELEKEKMQENVLKHEPHLALFVENDDALLFYRKILKFAENNLTSNGKLYFEINEYLKEELEILLADFKIKNYFFRKDIFGKYRMLKVQF